MSRPPQPSPSDTDNLSDLGRLLGLQAVAITLRKARSGTATPIELKRAEHLLRVVGHRLVERSQ